MKDGFFGRQFEKNENLPPGMCLRFMRNSLKAIGPGSVRKKLKNGYSLQEIGEKMSGYSNKSAQHCSARLDWGCRFGRLRLGIWGSRPVSDPLARQARPKPLAWPICIRIYMFLFLGFFFLVLGLFWIRINLGFSLILFGSEFWLLKKKKLIFLQL